MRSLLAVLLFAAPLGAQTEFCLFPEGELYSTSPEAGTALGWDTAADGDTLAVSQVYASPGGTVMVYRSQGTSWVVEGELNGSDTVGNDQMGYDIDIDGDRIVAGAWQHATVLSNDGAAYVFERSGGVWSETAKLTNADAAGFERFGVSVAVEGDVIAVGTLFGTGGGVSAPGAVYVYELVGGSWVETAKLNAPTAATGDQYGSAVAIHSGRIVVGEPLDDTSGSDRGACHTYTKVGGVWTLEQSLFSVGGSNFDAFGQALAVYEDTILVSAPRNNGNRGMVHAYRLDGGSWSHTGSFTAGEDELDGFGERIALGPTLAAFTQRSDDDGGFDAGAAFVYRRVGDDFEQVAKLVAPDPTITDQFGASIALAGYKVAVGCTQDDTTGQDTGSVRTWHVGGNFSEYGSGIAGTGGLTPRLFSPGCPVIQYPFTVEVEDGLPDALGVLLISLSEANLPSLGGTLLVGPPFFLLDVHTLDGAGGMQFDHFYNGLALAGMTFYLQAGYVDPGAPEGGTLTNGLRGIMP